MPSRKLTKRREAGFTLIELLVSLAVLGFAAALLVAGLNTAWLASRAESKTEDSGVAAAQMILRSRLERMAAVVRLDTSDPIVDAQGDSRLFSFYAPALPRLAPDALLKYRLLLSPAGDLFLYTAGSLNDEVDLRDRSLANWQPTLLISGVSEISLSYFGTDRFQDGERWQSIWIDRPQPPALIRIRLSFAPGDTRHWPDLVVRPRATVNTACRVQVSSGRCEAI